MVHFSRHQQASIPPAACPARWLRFANNRLEGSLPQEYAQLAPHLVQLTLDNNNFTGAVGLGWQWWHLAGAPLHDSRLVFASDVRRELVYCPSPCLHPHVLPSSILALTPPPPGNLCTMSESSQIGTGTANNPGLCGMVPVGVRFAVRACLKKCTAAGAALLGLEGMRAALPLVSMHHCCPPLQHALLQETVCTSALPFPCRSTTLIPRAPGWACPALKKWRTAGRTCQSCCPEVCRTRSSKPGGGVAAPAALPPALPTPPAVPPATCCHHP